MNATKKSALMGLGLTLCLSSYNLFAQTTNIEAVDSQYSSSAPPQHPTGIQYQLVKRNSSGVIESYDYTKCKFSYYIAQGTQYAGPNNPVINGNHSIYVVWDNYLYTGSNDQPRVVVTTINLNGTCPVGEIARTLNVPLRYIGDLDAIRLNGSPISTTSMACGTSSVTFSVPAPTTTAPSGAGIDYTWSVPSGWSITSGQGTNSIQVTPNASGTGNVTVQATRTDGPYVTKTKQASITRLLPTTPVINSGDIILCNPQNITASASNATSYNWQTTGGSNASTSGNNTAYITATGDGTVFVSAYSSACNYTSSNSASIKIHASAPSSNEIVITDDYGQGAPNAMCNGYGLTLNAINPKAQSYSWSLSGNSSNVYFTDYGNGRAYFNSYVNDCYGVSVTATNCFGSAQSGITICVNDCYGFFRVYPNPTKNVLALEFSEGRKKENFPEIAAIFSEKSSEKVKSVDIRKAFEKGELKDGKILEINVSELPRGVYYLHVINNDLKKDKTQIQRIVLE